MKLSLSSFFFPFSLPAQTYLRDPSQKKPQNPNLNQPLYVLFSELQQFCFETGWQSPCFHASTCFSYSSGIVIKELFPVVNTPAVSDTTQLGSGMESFRISSFRNSLQNLLLGFVLVFGR